MKLKKVVNEDEGIEAYYFHCPACGFPHRPHTRNDRYTGHVWSFSGDMERPTFEGSLKTTFAPDRFCHLIVTDGKIKYDSDSTHEFAGQTVEMVDIK